MTTQSQESSFTLAKEVFSDRYDDEYVNLDSSVVAYEKLLKILDKPIKLALLYGKPGTGKTFLLKKIYRDLSKKKPIIFFPTPFFDELEFLKKIYEKSFLRKAPNVATFDQLFQLMVDKVRNIDGSVTVFVDEAQMYPSEIVEKIRLLADTRKYKFVFTVHKTDQKEDVVAKDYFKTRIWESIELKNASFDEFKIYIEKKLMYHNMFDFVNKFSNKQYRAIYEYSNGNLRETNKIIYKLFEICEYYDIYEPSKISNKQINMKFLEMAAISLGYIDA